MPRLELVRTTSDAPAAVELTERLEAELVERYGPGGGASMPAHSRCFGRSLAAG
jgi:hypothetical protein